jgi:hypothetical protein
VGNLTTKTYIYMKKTTIILFFLLPVFLFSCDFLEDETGLTEEDVVRGLKTALEIGTDTSCTSLNKENGYYGDDILRILLPPEADPVLDVLDDITSNQILHALGTDKLIERQIDSVILGLNRAAEDAADEAKPIFINAITNMTITDGMDILYGTNLKDTTSSEFDSLAASHYLDLKTRIQLTEAFSPYVDASLDKDLGLGFSANTAWEKLVEYYNFAVPYLSDAEFIDENVTLGEHATLKALDGLFYLVGNEEKKIRKDPYQWADDIIQEVFGYVYEE